MTARPLPALRPQELDWDLTMSSSAGTRDRDSGAHNPADAGYRLCRDRIAFLGRPRAMGATSPLPRHPGWPLNPSLRWPEETPRPGSRPASPSSSRRAIAPARGGR